MNKGCRPSRSQERVPHYRQRQTLSTGFSKVILESVSNYLCKPTPWLTPRRRLLGNEFLHPIFCTHSRRNTREIEERVVQSLCKPFWVELCGTMLGILWACIMLWVKDLVTLLQYTFLLGTYDISVLLHRYLHHPSCVQSACSTLCTNWQMKAALCNLWQHSECILLCWLVNGGLGFQ